MPADFKEFKWFLGERNGNPSILAWRIPWTKEAGGLKSMGSQRVQYNWVTNTLSDFIKVKHQVSCVNLMKVKMESEKAGLKLNIQKTKIMASGLITSWKMGKLWKEWQTLFSWAPITADSDCSYGIERCLFHVKNVMTNLDSNWKAETLLCQKCLSSQSYGFSSSHAWMWELDYKESWALKIWCFLNCGVGEDYWDLDCKEIQSVHPKGNQFWIFIGRTDAEP